MKSFLNGAKYYLDILLLKYRYILLLYNILGGKVGFWAKKRLFSFNFDFTNLETFTNRLQKGIIYIYIYIFYLNKDKNIIKYYYYIIFLTKRSLFLLEL